MKPKTLIPYLWFDTQAVEATEFYCSIFPDSRVTSKQTVQDTPSGDCDMLRFELWGHRFESISAGPKFALNPSISFMVNFDPLFFQDADDPDGAARQKLNEIWKALSDGGQPLLDIGKYDFSPLYGWIQDKYGVSWQLILTDPDGDPRPSIMPSMLFVQDNCGKAEEAGAFYRSVFPESVEGMVARYPAGAEPDKEGTVMFSDMKLGDTWITAADSAYDHEFQFNEAASFMVYCDDQEEIDYYWDKLSAVPEAEQCGWLKDKYGISWQIVPTDLAELLEKGTVAQRNAVTAAFLQMKRFNVARLHQAFENAE